VASILRQGSPRTGDRAPQPAVFTLAEMDSQGERYTQSVREQAAKIVAAAKAEAAAIRTQAEADGRAAAMKEIDRLLDERVGKEVQTLRPALDAAVARLNAARGEWLEEWRRSAVLLAVAIAERIVRRELDNDPTVSEAWLAEALEHAAGSNDVTVRLAPDDHDRLRAHGEKLAEAIGGLGAMRFVADAAVTPGGCRVETRHGSIDQQLETQLRRLAEELDAAD